VTPRCCLRDVLVLLHLHLFLPAFSGLTLSLTPAALLPLPASYAHTPSFLFLSAICVKLPIHIDCSVQTTTVMHVCACAA
jgi:hypothetical protein